MDFVENDDLKFGDQLHAFAEGLGTSGALLGFDPGEIADALNDSNYWNWVMPNHTNAQALAQGVTRYKNLVRYGSGTEVLGDMPTLPLVVKPLAMVDSDIETRFRQRAAKAKISPNYTKALGETLRIEAPKTVIDRAYGKPVINIFTDSGHPLMKWVKGNYQGVEIWADHADGKGFQKVDRDFKSPWVDKHDLPAKGTSAVWKYKVIYLYNDETIGKYSDEISVSVYGEV